MPVWIRSGEKGGPDAALVQRKYIVGAKHLFVLSRLTVCFCPFYALFSGSQRLVFMPFPPLFTGIFSDVFPIPLNISVRFALDFCP